MDQVICLDENLKWAWHLNLLNMARVNFKDKYDTGLRCPNEYKEQISWFVVQ